MDWRRRKIHQSQFSFISWPRNSQLSSQDMHLFEMCTNSLGRSAKHSHLFFSCIIILQMLSLGLCYCKSFTHFNGVFLHYHLNLQVTWNSCKNNVSPFCFSRSWSLLLNITTYPYSTHHCNPLRNQDHLSSEIFWLFFYFMQSHCTLQKTWDKLTFVRQHARW